MYPREKFPVSPKSIALTIIPAAIALAVLTLTGCNPVTVAGNSLGNQLSAKETEAFIKAQGGITREEWAKQWLEVYNRGAIDQALTQIKGDPYITLETGDHGKLNVLRKVPIESYEAPVEVAEAWDEKRKQEELDAKPTKGRK